MNRLLLVSIAVLFIQSYSLYTGDEQKKMTDDMVSITSQEGGTQQRTQNTQSSGSTQRGTGDGTGSGPGARSRAETETARGNATNSRQAAPQQQQRAAMMEEDPIEEAVQGNSRILMTIRQLLGYDANVALFHLASNVPVPFPGLKLTMIPDDDEEEMMKDEMMKCGKMKEEVGEKVEEKVDEIKEQIGGEKENWSEQEGKISTLEKPEAEARENGTRADRNATKERAEYEGDMDSEDMMMKMKQRMGMGAKTFGVLSLDDISDVVQASNLVALDNKMQDGMIKIEASPRAIVGVLVITGKPTTFGIPMPSSDYAGLAELLNMKYEKAMDMEEKIKGAQCKARRLMKAQMMAEEVAAMDMEKEGEAEQPEREERQGGKQREEQEEVDADDLKPEAEVEEQPNETLVEAKGEGKMRPQQARPEREIGKEEIVAEVIAEKLEAAEPLEAAEKLEDVEKLAENPNQTGGMEYMTTVQKEGGMEKKGEAEEEEEEVKDMKSKKASFVAEKAMKKQKKQTLMMRRARNVLENAFVAVVEKSSPGLIEQMIYRLSESEGSCMDADKERGDEEALDREPLDDEEDMEEARFMPDMEQVKEIAKMSTTIWNTAGIEVVQMPQMMARAERIAKMQRANSLKRLMRGEEDMEGYARGPRMMEKRDMMKDGAEQMNGMDKEMDKRGGGVQGGNWEGGMMDKKEGYGYNNADKREGPMGQGNWAQQRERREMVADNMSYAQKQMMTMRKRMMFRFRRDANMFLSGEEEEEEMDEESMKGQCNAGMDGMDNGMGNSYTGSGGMNGGNGMIDGGSSSHGDDDSKPARGEEDMPEAEEQTDEQDGPTLGDFEEGFNKDMLVKDLRDADADISMERLIGGIIVTNAGSDADLKAIAMCMECDGCKCDGCTTLTAAKLVRAAGLGAVNRVKTPEIAAALDEGVEKCVPEFIDNL